MTKDFSYDTTFFDFSSGRIKLAWISHTRPDVQFDVSQLEQITKNAFNTDRLKIVKNLSKVVKYVMETDAATVILKLEMNPL